MRPKRTGDRDLFAGRCCVDPRTGEYPVNHLRAITVAGFLAATVLSAAAAEISGAGATFPYPVYAKWADTYRKETGV
jgi:ABC-type phosphate transport system substrate-binding protein